MHPVFGSRPFRPAFCVTTALAVGSVALAAAARAAGDPEAGVRVFRQCASCHSLAPGRHMTGPSLAGVWGRKAGTVEGFRRYSRAVSTATVVWNEQTLDAWLANPKAVIPGNHMAFQGVRDQTARADLIALLRTVGADSGGGAPQVGRALAARMRGPELPNLRELAPDQRVTAIAYCGDTYRVTTAAGELPPFWEFNLRLKTDSSETGPAKGRPAIMGAGMQGDRASVIFADPAEISVFIDKKC
jgi:cytochrome c